MTAISAVPIDAWSTVLGVSHNEDTSSSVRGPDVDSAERNGIGSITSIPELLHHARKPALDPTEDVLDNDCGRSDLVDETEEVKERVPAPSLSPEPRAPACGADVLACESPAKNIDSCRMGDRRDIGEPRNVWEMVRENASRERVNLALPRDPRRDASLEKGR
jgi:hypothetical protein